MAIARFGRLAKRSYKSYGFCVRLTAVVILGLCFIFVWSVFSPNSLSVTSRRDIFDDIAEPISGNGEATNSGIQLKKKEIKNDGKEDKEDEKIQTLGGKDNEKINGSPPLKSGNGNKDQKQVAKEKRQGKNVKAPKEVDKEKVPVTERSEDEYLQEEKQEEDVNSNEEETDNGEGNEEGQVEGDNDLGNTFDLDQEIVEKVEGDSTGSGGTTRNMKKNSGPLFDPKVHYAWKLCTTRSKHNYIPCIDIESGTGRLQSYRHHERSCPKISVMCLVPLPHDGYETPVSWPESKEKVWNLFRF